MRGLSGGVENNSGSGFFEAVSLLRGEISPYRPCALVANTRETFTQGYEGFCSHYAKPMMVRGYSATGPDRYPLLADRLEEGLSIAKITEFALMPPENLESSKLFSWTLDYLYLVDYLAKAGIHSQSKSIGETFTREVCQTISHVISSDCDEISAELLAKLSNQRSDWMQRHYPPSEMSSLIPLKAIFEKYLANIKPT